MSVIAERVDAIRERIQQAAVRSGRNLEDITLVGVTKTVPLLAIREAVDAGIQFLGENYVQEALSKVEAVPNVSWQFIGHLQSNKVRQILGRFDCIQSVDSEKLLLEIGRRSVDAGIVQPILIEVNLDPDSAKTGTRFDEVGSLIELAATTNGVRLDGVMGIPPVGSAEDARPHFARLRTVFESLPIANRRWLSMGMTADFEVAIEEGATMVRIGSAIFGSRM